MSQEFSRTPFLVYVTRQMLAQGGGFPAKANITIFVTAGTSTVCYIACTEETGPVVFMLKQIRKPVGSDWSNTLRGYQMYTTQTEKALARVDAEDDTKHFGCATSLGAKFGFRVFIAISRLAAGIQIRKKFRCFSFEFADPSTAAIALPVFGNTITWT